MIDAGKLLYDSSEDYDNCKSVPKEKYSQYKEIFLHRDKEVHLHWSQKMPLVTQIKMLKQVCPWLKELGKLKSLSL